MIVKIFDLDLDLERNAFQNNISKNEVFRYIKGMQSKKGLFDRDFSFTINELKQIMLDMNCLDLNQINILESFKENILDVYDDIKPFSYKEAFELKDQAFQALVFGSVDIRSMIEELGCERVAVEGKKVQRKQFNQDGVFLGWKEYDNVYETYSVKGKKLGVEDDLAVIKCWCTSTNKEHFIWIENQFINSPLEAIASTFRFHENVIPKIKSMKRQGDIMLLEMSEEVIPEGDVRPLTAEEYFGLLDSES